MTSGMSFKAYAPASIGNVSVGFDVLGAALAPIDQSLLGDCVTATIAPSFVLTVSGRFASRLPQGVNNNIVTRCYEFFNQYCQKRNIATQTLALHLDKALPIGSGLGSSASSIVAAFYAINQANGGVFDDNTLLYMMGECEGEISGSVHYDNVAPALYGGMTLMTGLPQPICESVPVFTDWYWVSCYSGITVSTAQARELLPKQWPTQTLLTFGRQLACFIHASHSGNDALAANVLKDVIAEPYRHVLLPHFEETKTHALSAGALGFGISGSGPTVFAACDSLEIAQQIAEYCRANYIQNDDGFCHICRIDTAGTRLI